MISPIRLKKTISCSLIFYNYVRTPEKGALADDEECAVEKYYRPVFVQKPPENIQAEEGKLVRFNVKVE